MNCTQEAVDKLRDYAARKQSLVSIPEEIKTLEEASVAIRSATADGTPVQGGGSGRENALLNNIVKRQELEKALVNAKAWVRIVDNALGVLSPEEKEILQRMYIDRQRGAAMDLAAEMGIDTKTVYKRKDAALRRFTLALYGVTEI